MHFMPVVVHLEINFHIVHRYTFFTQCVSQTRATHWLLAANLLTHLRIHTLHIRTYSYHLPCTVSSILILHSIVLYFTFHLTVMLLNLILFFHLEQYLPSCCYSCCAAVLTWISPMGNYSAHLVFNKNNQTLSILAICKNSNFRSQT